MTTSGSHIACEPAARASPGRVVQWHDALTPRAFALLLGFALLTATTYFWWGGHGSLRWIIRRHMYLHDWWDFGYALSTETWTVIAIALGVVWIVHRIPRHAFPQYACAIFVVALVCTLRMALQYAQATHYSLRLEDILPEGIFDFLKIDFSKDPQAHDILYGSMNRLSLVFGLWLEPFAYGSVLSSAYLYVRAQADTARALAQSQLDTEGVQKEITAARLQMLEAQIEPHFLFNTLANVKRLYETESVIGARMLDNLMRYLEEALPHMRDTDATLAREVALTEAYLNVQQIRMGRRLQFSIDVPPPLSAAHMPPMMLLTLVENAIKHGLNPLPQGGTLCIRASTERDRMMIEVADTGRGFAQASGAGNGLANIRARLALAYGAGATLTLRVNSPRGIVAVVDLPFNGIAPLAQAA